MISDYDKPYDRVCARDVITFSNPKLKIHSRFLSSSGIRCTNFIPVYNFPAQ